FALITSVGLVLIIGLSPWRESDLADYNWALFVLGIVLAIAWLLYRRRATALRVACGMGAFSALVLGLGVYWSYVGSTDTDTGVTSTFFWLGQPAVIWTAPDLPYRTVYDPGAVAWHGLALVNYLVAK